MEETYDLALLAKEAMRSRGLKPDFSSDVLQEVRNMNSVIPHKHNISDLSHLKWCSIDNDDSRDLDQLTFAEKSGHLTTIWVAIADVGEMVTRRSAVDQHAQFNTTSVYTPTRVFSMLPERLSTDLTSLNPNEDRLSVVVKMQVDKNGDIIDSSITESLVHNYAKLTYNEIGPWLEGTKPIPDKVRTTQGLEDTLKLQHEVAKALKKRRHQQGSLSLQTSELSVKAVGDKIIFRQPSYNVARLLIEEFMIAANVEIAKYLQKTKISSLRRVVRIPKRWSRIVEVAKEMGEKLPDVPDSEKLDAFLLKRKKVDPESFYDLSLTIIKLLGRGEYIVQRLGDPPIGHFGLALKNYTHATAPNRRFPDLISQRQFKAFVNAMSAPYSLEELEALAQHCTKQEDAAVKVERQTNKSAAALFLSTCIGTSYKGIITGASDKGTWVKVGQQAIEGRIIKGFEGLDVGDKVNVRLHSVDVPKGHINFVLN